MLIQNLLIIRKLNLKYNFFLMDILIFLMYKRKYIFNDTLIKLGLKSNTETVYIREERK